MEASQALDIINLVLNVVMVVLLIGAIFILSSLMQKLDNTLDRLNITIQQQTNALLEMSRHNNVMRGLE